MVQQIIVPALQLHVTRCPTARLRGTPITAETLCKCDVARNTNRAKARVSFDGSRRTEAGPKNNVRLFITFL